MAEPQTKRTKTASSNGAISEETKEHHEQNNDSDAAADADADVDADDQSITLKKPLDPNVIDLRSDTVTRPTLKMRSAMFSASVGDDVMGDDPTIKALEQKAAQFLGKEAALFVPSGTMGNLISIMVHCREKGSELIVGDRAHIYIWEQGGCATVAGVHPRAIPTEKDGTLDLQKVEAAIRKVDDHEPTTRLICIENTHNACGGRVLPVEYMDKIGALAKKHNLKLHVDGARLANAAVALKVPAARLVQSADSVSLCLSKGLAAPVGSVIAGTTDFIKQARRFRKVLGGGLRQSGIIAAAGLVALEEMVDRLQEDHDNAKALAAGVCAIQGITLETEVIESNIFWMNLDKSQFDLSTIKAKFQEKGILILQPADTGRMRLVTHYQIKKEHVPKIISAFVDARIGRDETK